MKKYTLSQFGIVFILLFALSCKKYDPKVVAVISTGNVNGIYATQAQAIGNISGIGDLEIIQHGHCWSSANDVPDFRINQGKTLLGSKENDGSFTSSLGGLYPNTTFYVRSYYIANNDTIYGNDIQVFKTKDTTAPLPPNVATGIDSAVFAFNFYIKGSILNIGSSNVSSYGHCYSSSNANPTILDTKNTLGNTTLPLNFTSNISGLNEQTKYYVRAYATNATGTAYGTVIEVITKSNITLASVTTLDTFDLNWDRGNIFLQGELTNTGNQNCDYGHVFNINTNALPTISDNKIITGNTISALSYSSTIESVKTLPLTKYNYRAFATNSNGETYGTNYSYLTNFTGKIFNQSVSDNFSSYGTVSASYKGEFYFGLGIVDGDENRTTGQWKKYNPTTNTIDFLASCPIAMAYANCFVYNDKIYVIAGKINNSSTYGNACMSYDPSTNTWQVEKSYPTLCLYGAYGFLIGNKYYLTCGTTQNTGGFAVITNFRKNTYEVDLSTFTMTSVADLPSDERSNGASFALNGKGYIIAGMKNISSPTGLAETWEYDPTTNIWTQRPDVPLSAGITGVAFCNGDAKDDYGYFIAGIQNFVPNQNVSRYDPINNKWRVINKIPNSESVSAGCASFVDSKMVYAGGLLYGVGYTKNIYTLE